MLSQKNNVMTLLQSVRTGDGWVQVGTTFKVLKDRCHSNSFSRVMCMYCLKFPFSYLSLKLESLLD